MKSDGVVSSREKFIIMVGWKPPDKNLMKLNANGVYFIGMTSGCRGIIRNMHDKCNSGFSNHIGKCSDVRAEL